MGQMVEQKPDTTQLMMEQKPDTTQLMGQMVEQKSNTTDVGTNNSDLLTRISMITAMIGKKIDYHYTDSSDKV